MQFLYEKFLEFINYEISDLIKNVCDPNNIAYTYLLLALALKIKLARKKDKFKW